MAHTYKIKPLEWRYFGSQKHEGAQTNKYLHVIHFEDNDLFWAVFCWGRGIESREFKTESAAKAWIEEQHIAKVREYLEEL